MRDRTSFAAVFPADFPAPFSAFFSALCRILPSASSPESNLTAAFYPPRARPPLGVRNQRRSAWFCCLALMQPLVSLAQTPGAAPMRAETPATANAVETLDPAPNRSATPTDTPVEAPAAPAQRTRLTHEERRQLRHDIKRAGQELYPPARAKSNATNAANATPPAKTANPRQP